jgi:osmoprotectant transport system permease protein
MAGQTLLEFLGSRAGELGTKTLEHFVLTGVSVAAAAAVGVPLGLWIRRSALWRGPVLGAVSVVQTVPSLALLAVLLPAFGIGVKPTLVALALYALLPIVRNTYTGLREVSPEALEAARGLGFTPGQRFRLVELPLALPVIVAGIRTSTVICVGIATIAACIGAGGLGDFIFRGLAMRNMRLILLGAVSAAIMALVLDFGIGRVERVLTRKWKQGGEIGIDRVERNLVKKWKQEGGS